MPNLFNNSSQPIGSIQASLLTETQFQSQFGAGWVLAKGQNVSGSNYANITGSLTVPDLRGVFLRGKNNGRSDGNENPDGESSLGTYQGDQLSSHNHTYTRSSSVDPGWGQYAAGGGANSNQVAVTSTGGNETRSKNVTVNYFIRIN